MIIPKVMSPDVLGGQPHLTMTAGELISQLKRFYKNTPVITEGCDCFGIADYVQEEVDDNGMVFLCINRG